MRIGELAAALGMSVDTIRFYERRGLLSPEHVTRGANNYRDYSQAAVARLRLARQGQAAGFTIAEMAESIGAWEADEISLGDKALFLRRKVEEIDARIQELAQIRSFLVSKLDSMPDSPAHDRYVADDLALRQRE